MKERCDEREVRVKHLGWQCRDFCLLATPPKQPTFVSVANMLAMSTGHVGNILLSRPFFAVSVVLGETVANIHSCMYIGSLH